jgi:hypothetical protein
LASGANASRSVTLDREITAFRELGRFDSNWRQRLLRSVACTSAILLAQMPCDTATMARSRKSKPQDHRPSGAAPNDDLYDYARPPAARPGRPAPEDPMTWTVKDDWPEDVPITEAEIEVFEAWFGDLFDELFSTRH